MQLPPLSDGYRDRIVGRQRGERVAKSWHSQTSGSTSATGLCKPHAIDWSHLRANGEPSREFQALRSQAKYRAACPAIVATYGEIEKERLGPIRRSAEAPAAEGKSRLYPAGPSGRADPLRQACAECVTLDIDSPRHKF